MSFWEAKRAEDDAREAEEARKALEAKEVEEAARKARQETIAEQAKKALDAKNARQLRKAEKDAKKAEKVKLAEAALKAEEELKLEEQRRAEREARLAELPRKAELKAAAEEEERRRKEAARAAEEKARKVAEAAKQAEATRRAAETLRARKAAAEVAAQRVKEERRALKAKIAAKRAANAGKARQKAEAQRAATRQSQQACSSVASFSPTAQAKTSLATNTSAAVLNHTTGSSSSSHQSVWGTVDRPVEIRTPESPETQVEQLTRYLVARCGFPLHDVTKTIKELEGQESNLLNFPLNNSAFSHLSEMIQRLEDERQCANLSEPESETTGESTPTASRIRMDEGARDFGAPTVGGDLSLTAALFASRQNGPTRGQSLNKRLSSFLAAEGGFDHDEAEWATQHLDLEALSRATDRSDVDCALQHLIERLFTFDDAGKTLRASVLKHQLSVLFCVVGGFAADDVAELWATVGSTLSMVATESDFRAHYPRILSLLWQIEQNRSNLGDCLPEGLSSEESGDYEHWDEKAWDDSSDSTPEVNGTECCVCLDREIGTVLVPCGHMILCVPCSKSVMSQVSIKGPGSAKCPACRAPVETCVETVSA
ncbi:hypothetical protein HDU88_003924 [Geranomyces variabilis]|nr:hypothetical protein HDU88_003924 [Geranomyces variabilis]